MASIELDNVVKKFGENTVVNNISLTIADGEFFTLLGPSGCGKTTLLRMLAGFLFPDGGDIRFGKKSIINTPAHKRETGMVFQNYALFPHLTVSENVAYGLKARGVHGAERTKRVNDMLESVHLPDMGDRYPRQLSGGQQQRVALARAMVIEPQVLLMDEPLSNLDAKLRVDMREEIRRIQKKSGITTVYVTHDQEEAMAISDRITILSGGHMQQVGSPWDIYYRPANTFAAQFMGSCTLLEVQPKGQEDGLLQGSINGKPVSLKLENMPQGDFTVMLRPDWIKAAGPQDVVNRFTGVVREATFIGPAISYEVDAFGKSMRVDLPAANENAIKKIGDSIDLYFEIDRPVVVAK